MTERVWDAFLTAEDQEHLALTGHQPKGFGERPALLLVDLYRWVFGDRAQPLEEAIKIWPGSCGPAAWEALPHIQRLLAAARAAGIPVIYSTGLQGDGLMGWGRGSAAQKEPEEPDALERSHRGYDIIDEVAPLSNEAIIRKAAPSAFWGTALIGHLTRLGVDTLLVGGESTSGCVRATVVDGATCGFRMVVAEECVFDRHQAPHAINLFDMNQKYADVLPLSQVLSYLEQHGADSRRAAGQLTGIR
jgi:maleamate amidohydrolase